MSGLDALEDLRMRQEHAGRSPGSSLRSKENARPPAARRRARRTCRRAISAPAGRRGCRSDDRPRARCARIIVVPLAQILARGMAHIDSENVRPGFEQPLDHLGLRGCRSQGRDDFDAPISSHCVAAPPSPGSVNRTVQSFSSLCVDFEKARAFVIRVRAVLDAANGERLVGGAHDGLAAPFAAAIIIERVNIVIARDERAFQQHFAGLRGDVPPAFADPAGLVLISDCDTDAAGGRIAELEIRRAEDGPAEISGAKNAGEQSGMRTRMCLFIGFHVWRGALRLRHAGSTRMTRRSLTLVKVGPLTIRSSNISKNPVELFFARNSAGIPRLFRAARERVR